MKKLLLLLIVVVLSITASAQPLYYRTYRTSAHEMDNYTKEWNKVSDLDVDISITVSKRQIFIESEVAYTINTYGEKRMTYRATYETATWDCYWYEDGIKRYGEFAITAFNNGEMTFWLLFRNRGIRVAICYDILR